MDKDQKTADIMFGVIGTVWLVGGIAVAASVMSGGNSASASNNSGSGSNVSTSPIVQPTRIGDIIDARPVSSDNFTMSQTTYDTFVSGPSTLTFHTWCNNDNNPNDSANTAGGPSATIELIGTSVQEFGPQVAHWTYTFNVPAGRYRLHIEAACPFEVR